MREQMDLTERKLGREDKFTGRIVSVHVDTVELPDGETALREVVDHPGGVAVLALDGGNNVLTILIIIKYYLLRPFILLQRRKKMHQRFLPQAEIRQSFPKRDGADWNTI